MKRERRLQLWGIAAALAVLLLFSASCSNSKLEQQIEAMSNQLGILEDTQAIRNLHHAYGYYIDKCLYEDVVDLFAEDGEVHFAGGIYRGRTKGVRRLYVESFLEGFTAGKPGPAHGFLLDHLQMQDVIHVDPDRKTAKARFRAFMQAGAHETSKSPMGEADRKAKRKPTQWWEGGIYENSYVKEDGVWKIQILNYNPLWHADYANGWAHTRVGYLGTDAPVLYPQNPTGPDALMDSGWALWPETMIVPFHYKNPVTGKPLIMEKR
ncbi:MAG: nuclear transport factor 2 family protein [Acidobacteria bacterium]|nr:nuclear transport factor 2 family protein [Acidobacteriota bacterium]